MTASTDEEKIASAQAQFLDEGKAATPRGTFIEVLSAFARLGVTSFGGPVAHLGYFREDIVRRRGWVDEQTYADLVGLCQFLPGPASSQVGMSLGIMRAGIPGALAAWLGFTLPSAVALTLFAYLTRGEGGAANAGWLHGLMLVAVAVVAQAVWGMGRTLTPDAPRATMAIIAATVALLLPAGLIQVAIIAVAGLVGWLLFRRALNTSQSEKPLLHVPVPRGVAIACLVTFALLLVGLPLVEQVANEHALALFASMYRSGALVFGGGHVVLPLLQASVVAPGWVTDSQFLAGYGAAQAVPGPLFTFSAYLGAVEGPHPNGWAGAAISLVGIFLPSFLLVLGVLPFWNSLRARGDFQAALRGINAAVVGLLLAALYQPVWTSTVKTPLDFAVALAAFGLLVWWKLPPWVVVVAAAVVGIALFGL
jgi:chromate transporter